MTSFSNIWSRIQKETDLNKINELAELVETTPQYLSRKKSKDEFSVEWAFRVSQKYGLNTDWIMTGEGLKRNDIQVPPYENNMLYEIDKWLTELIVKEPFRKEWFIGAFLDAFPKFNQWKKIQDNVKNKNNIHNNSKAA